MSVTRQIEGLHPSTDVRDDADHRNATARFRSRPLIPIPFWYGSFLNEPAMHSALFGVHTEERAMNTDPIELVDLGDATEETKQFLPIPVFPDNYYFYGLAPSLG